MNIKELLKDKAQKYGDNPALIFRETSISFAELPRLTFKLANALRQLGVQKGDKVAICLPNSLEFVYSDLACLALGAVAVPLDFMLKTDELTSCLAHSEAKIFIVQPRNDISLSAIKATVPSLQKMIVTTPDSAGEGILLYADIVNEASSEAPAVSIADSDPALIMYTSGTTGQPKGILLTYKHLEGSPKAMEYFVDLSDRDVKLAAIPFSHIGGFIYIQNCLVFGITLVVMERFNPYEFLANIERHRVTCFHIVPAMYTAILSLKQIEKFNLGSLRWVVVLGRPVRPRSWSGSTNFVRTPSF